MSYTVQRNASGGYSIVDRGDTIADYHTKEAAQMGAAAPDLLEALIEASKWGNDFPDEVSIMVCAAIAKAEGRA